MKIDELIPLEKNPFKHRGDKQIEMIGKSIKDFQEMMSIRKIVIDEKNEILGGNKRYFALKMLGYEEIPDDWVHRVEGLTAEQKKEFVVKDNAHWGSEWDFDMLNEWNIDLQDFGVEFEDFLEEPLDLDEEFKNKDYELKIRFDNVEAKNLMEKELKEVIDKYKTKTIIISGGEI